MKMLQVQVEDGEEDEFLALAAAFRAGWLRAPAVELPDGCNYQEAVAQVQGDPASSFKVKQRIAEDAGRDPLDALADAELLHALAAKRFGELAQGGTQVEHRAAVTHAGVAALRRLFEVAQGHSGQCAKIARFLLCLYNGERFPFDLTLLRSVDRALFEDCMSVLAMDMLGQQEVHTFFPNGGRKWEAMAGDWRVVDVEAALRLARQLVERTDGLAGLGDVRERLNEVLEGTAQG